MAKPKTIILGPTPPPYGGVAIFVSALYALLRDRAVKLWTYSDQETKDEQITYLKPFRLGLLATLIRQAFKARILDSSSFVIEHPHKILAPLWVTAKLCLRFEWVKVVHDGSLPARYPRFGSIEKALFRIALRAVSEFVVVNEELKTWLKKSVGVSQRISVIKSLLPIPPASFSAVLDAHLDQVISGHAKSICSIGVFIPAYGFKHVAEAVATIRAESGEDIGLVLIDCGYVNDAGYESEVLAGREWIVRLAELPQPDVLQVLKRSDVFVRAFGFESYGLSRVEAIWCGVPVVATRAGETRGMLTYDFGDQAELIEQLKKALWHVDSQDLQHWAALFHREAQENLQELIKAIELEGNVAS